MIAGVLAGDAIGVQVEPRMDALPGHQRRRQGVQDEGGVLEVRLGRLATDGLADDAVWGHVAAEQADDEQLIVLGVSGGGSVHHVPQTSSATEQFPMRSQSASECESAAVDAGPHRPDRDPHDAGDLRVVVAVHVEQDDAVALLERQRIQGLGQGPGALDSERLAFRFGLLPGRRLPAFPPEMLGGDWRLRAQPRGRH